MKKVFALFLNFRAALIWRHLESETLKSVQKIYREALNSPEPVFAFLKAIEVSSAVSETDKGWISTIFTQESEVKIGDYEFKPAQEIAEALMQRYPESDPVLTKSNGVLHDKESMEKIIDILFQAPPQTRSIQQILQRLRISLKQTRENRYGDPIFLQRFVEALNSKFPGQHTRAQTMLEEQFRTVDPNLSTLVIDPLKGFMSKVERNELNLDSLQADINNPRALIGFVVNQDYHRLKEGVATQATANNWDQIGEVLKCEMPRDIRSEIIQGLLDTLSIKFAQPLSEDKALVKIIFEVLSGRESGTLSESILGIQEPKKLFDYKLGQGLMHFLAQELHKEGIAATSTEFSSTKTVFDIVLASENSTLGKLVWDQHKDELCAPANIARTLSSLSRHSSYDYVRRYISEALQHQNHHVECVTPPTTLRNRVRFSLDASQPHIVAFKVQGNPVCIKIHPHQFRTKEAMFEFIRRNFPESSEKHIFQMES